MSEPTTPEPQQTAPEASQQQPESKVDDLPQWARDAISKANREAANYRTKLNEVQPLADQFKQLEEASKSELQRIQEAQAAAERRAEQAAAEAIRYKAAATYGISADHFDLLGSGSEDEITARAEKISALIAAQAAQQAPPAKPLARPIEQLRPGATPAEAESEEDAVYNGLFGASR